MLRFNPIGFFPVGSLRAAARRAISGNDYQPADSDRVRPERSPRLRGAPQVQDEMDRDARRPVAKGVATFRRADLQISYFSILKSASSRRFRD